MGYVRAYGSRTYGVNLVANTKMRFFQKKSQFQLIWRRRIFYTISEYINCGDILAVIQMSFEFFLRNDVQFRIIPQQ